MSSNIKINYIELQVKDIELAKEFYGKTFGWTFQDFSPDYSAFNDGQMDGGFFKSGLSSSTSNGGALVVLYTEDLEGTQNLIVSNGGKNRKGNLFFSRGQAVSV